MPATTANDAPIARRAVRARRAPSFIVCAALLLMVGGRAPAARTIEHAFGETVVRGTPERIVTLYQGATDTAIALGIEPVGVVDSWIQRPSYRYLRDDLQGIAHVGLETQPSLEDIAWLQPDLIIATQHRHEPVKGLLAEIAPTVALRTTYDFKATLALLGRASGRQARARQLLREWNARVADFRARIDDAVAWPQEAAVIEFKSDHARIYYDGFAGSILDELGFARPPSHRDRNTWGIKLTNRESIPAMEADVLFVMMDADDPAVVRTWQRWSSHPLWQALTAAREDRVYRVDPVIWNLGGGLIAAHRLLDDLYAHYGLAADGQAPAWD